MSVSDSVPVIVGVGQVTEHLGDGFVGEMPEQLAALACEQALEDAGASLRGHIDHLAYVRMFAHSVPDEFTPVIAPFGRSTSPPRSVINRLALSDCRAIYSRAGGDEPQRLVAEFARAIQSGAMRAGLICGAEAIATIRHLQRHGETRDWSETPSGETEDRGMGTEFAYEPEFNRHGAFAPVDIYPLLEQAHRGDLGHSREAYRGLMSKVMSRLAQVAERNPLSMFHEPSGAEALGAETPRNRIIGDPHLKSMVAKDGVNQSAALVMTSFGVAQSLGIADRAIFLHGHGEAVEQACLSREKLGKTPAMAAAYQAALASAGISVDQVAAFDLYSCFPIAVIAAMEVLGLDVDDPRSLTLTGGLPFFGGPGNNYSMHGIAEMVRFLRAQRDKSFGVVGANGGYLSKHAVGVYANRPSEQAVFDGVSAVIEASEPVSLNTAPEGRGVIESFTIRPKAEGPRIIVVGRLAADQSRWVGLANTEHEATRDWFLQEDPMGGEVVVTTGAQNRVERA